jgi:hypothetical protein
MKIIDLLLIADELERINCKYFHINNHHHNLWIVNNSELIILSPRILSDQSLTYLIDVDNYGRIYTTDDELGIPSVMFGVNIYYSKLKLHMLTSTNDFLFFSLI